MRTQPLVYIGVSLLFLGSTAADRSVAWAGNKTPSTYDSHNVHPTMGGEPAFATKAEAMASTVQGLIQAEKLEGAEKAASELTSVYPSYAQGWLLLGYCRSLTLQYEASNCAYDRAEALGIEQNIVLTRKAYNYIKLGEFDSARQSYHKVLVTNPEDGDALVQLAYLEGKLGNLDEAALNYRRALGLDPKNTAIIASLVKIEEKRGMNGDVKRLLEQGLEQDPMNTKFLSRLASIHLKEKHYSAALKYLDRLIAIDDNNATAHRNRGVAYYHLGKKRAAVEAFERVRTLGGDMDGLYGPLAESYFKAGSYDEAVGVIREGIERGVQTAWLYCVWGNVKEGLKDYDGAASKFHQAMALEVTPWSEYARKQIARQTKLKQRAAIISSQQRMR